MKKRDGASLLNVMVFMLFAVMITAQVFFFAKWSADSVAEEREIMMYRLNLDSLVEEAKDALKVKWGNERIVHDFILSASDSILSTYTDIPGDIDEDYLAQVLKKVLDENEQSLKSGDELPSILINDYGAIDGYIKQLEEDYLVRLFGEAEFKKINTYAIIKNLNNTTDIKALILNKINSDFSDNIVPDNVLDFREFSNDKKPTYGKIAGDELAGKTTISTKARQKDKEYYVEVSTPYYAEIRDLDYRFDDTFDANDRDGPDGWIEKYGNKNANKKLFAAMPPKKDDDGNITRRYFLIRAWAELPDNYYGRKLMYQVLVRRYEDTYEVDTLSFQEVWF